MFSIALFKSWLRVFLHPWTPIFGEELDRRSNVRTLAGVWRGEAILSTRSPTNV